MAKPVHRRKMGCFWLVLRLALAVVIVLMIIPLTDPQLVLDAVGKLFNRTN